MKTYNRNNIDSNLNRRLNTILDKLEVMDKKLDSIKISSNSKDNIDKRLQIWLNK